MGSLTLLSFAASFTYFWIDCLASAGSKTVEVGSNVSLECQNNSTSGIEVFEWSRPDLNPHYVLYYRNEHVHEKQQNLWFKGRVKLKDTSFMKTGDVSLILKNVTINDTGNYECRIISTDTKRRKRDEPEPITTIHLKVTNSGGDEDGGGKTVGNRKYFALVPVLLVWMVVIFAVVSNSQITSRIQHQSSHRGGTSQCIFVPVPSPDNGEGCKSVTRFLKGA